MKTDMFMFALMILSAAGFIFCLYQMSDSDSIEITNQDSDTVHFKVYNYEFQSECIRVGGKVYPMDGNRGGCIINEMNVYEINGIHINR